MFNLILCILQTQLYNALGSLPPNNLQNVLLQPPTSPVPPSPLRISCYFSVPYTDKFGVFGAPYVASSRTFMSVYNSFVSRWRHSLFTAVRGQTYSAMDSGLLTDFHKNLV